MVSCDTRISSTPGYVSVSHPEICCGDHHWASFSSTTTRSLVLTSQFGGFGSSSPPQGSPIGSLGPMPMPAPIACHLPAHRRRCPTQPTGDLTQRLPSSHPPRKISSRSITDRCRGCRRRGTGRTPPQSSIKGPHRRLSTQPACDPTHRLTALPTIPHLSLLQLREPHHQPPQQQTSTLAEDVASTPRDHSTYRAVSKAHIAGSRMLSSDCSLGGRA